MKNIRGMVKNGHAAKKFVNLLFGREIGQSS